MANKAGIWIIGGAFLVAGLSGCSSEANKNLDDAGTTLKADADKAGKSISSATADSRKALSNDATSVSVKQALMAAKDLKAGDINVNTTDTKVTLTGSVPTASQKSRAHQIAQGVLGPNFKLVDAITVVPE